MITKIITTLKSAKSLFMILLCINLFVVLYHFSYKQGFHSDEQWSYAHANSSIGAYLDKDIDSFYQITDSIRSRLFNQFIDAEILHKYLTVSNDKSFTYTNIYKNLEVVEHPPLYYILLHTISSFYPNTFNKWQAGTLNLTIFILIYIMLFKLSKLLLKDERLALCVVALWGFSEIGIDTAIFLRMYILQTLLSICLVYETLKILDKNSATKKDLFLVFLYSFLGIFNQYNSIFFSFFVTLVSFCVFIKRKNYTLAFKFCFVMLLSFLMLFALYPQAYNVLFGSLRGTQVLSSIKNNRDIMSMLWSTEIKLSRAINTYFSHFLVVGKINNSILSFIFIVSIFSVIYFKVKIDNRIKWLISIVLLYFIYLTYMPYMHIFHNRYYMSIMPFIALLSINLIWFILKKINLTSKYVIYIITIFVIINSIMLKFAENSPYSFIYNKQEYDALNKIKNNTVFIDNGDNFIWLHSMVYYLANAKSVFITEDICDEISLKNIKRENAPIILTYSSYTRSNSNYSETECLKDIGLNKLYKICPSQHCYNVWEK